MYRKLVEAVVSSLVAVLKLTARPGYGEFQAMTKARRAGAIEVAVHLLVRPGADHNATRNKLVSLFDDVHDDWVATKLAEERLVEAVLA